MLTILCMLAVYVNGVDLNDSDCKKGLPSECDVTAKYRTIDGSCNNINHPEWGKTNIPFLRCLEPDYDTDGNPRTTPTLPGARDISSTINCDNEEKSPVFTSMHMTFGQFLDHDLTLRKTYKGVTCGEDNCSDEGECFPIHVPENDPDFPDSTCIEFVRSFGDTVGESQREQFNAITSYIDGNSIYGDDVIINDKLRDRSDPSRGKLKVTPHPVKGLKGLLPQDDGANCQNTNETIKCFLAGNKRVNVQLGLTAIQTIFHRAHNKIEDQLHYINLPWGGEKLYEETRRIIAAAIQQIAYNEFLPLLLGPDTMEAYDLTLTEGEQFWNGYGPDTNAGIFNSFAAAAFRFGHSQVGNIIRFTNAMFSMLSDRELTTEMNNPLSFYVNSPDLGSGVDAVMRGHCSLAADTVETHMSKQMTAHLLTPNPPFGIGSDLAARNIQRGRDHGIPSYTKWRAYCGLSANLEDIPQTDKKELLNVYQTMENIDLWVGGLAETHLPQAMVGPTFACLIGKQFRNLRAGDRFWFENDDQYHGFTGGQLAEIRKFTLAYLTCVNGDDIQEIQPKMMLQPLDDVPRQFKDDNADIINFLYGIENNARIKCEDIPAPNLAEWYEN